MAAVVEESFRRLLAVVNLDQSGSCWMRFSEMGAEPTLACMQCDHRKLLSGLDFMILLVLRTLTVDCGLF